MIIIGRDRAETIKLTAENMGITEREAAFYVAIGLADIDSDVIYVDEKGQPLAEQPKPRSIMDYDANGQPLK